VDSRQLGLVIVAVGVVTVVVGVLVAVGGLSWFGRLPGDIRIESGDTRVYVPVVSMLVVSVVLSLLLAVFRRFF